MVRMMPGSHCRRRVAMIAMLVMIVLLRGASAPSASSPSTSIIQSEAASITAHGGGTTFKECMALWDVGAHMSKAEWKAACMRTMVLEFHGNEP
jgi:hypothetical protein